MIIELAGLPGSGKTTVARSLAQEFPLLRRLAPLGQQRPAPRHLPRLLLESLRPAGIGPATGWPAWARLWSCWRVSASLQVNEATLDLLEEGTLHLVWRALHRHPALHRAPWPRLLALPHPVVILEAPVAVRHTRIVGKHRKGRVNLALASGPGSEAWERGERLWADLLTAIPAGRTVHRVESTGTEAETLQRVATAVRELQEGVPQRQQAHAHR